MKYQGIDTAARVSAKSATTLRGLGFDFVARYLVPNSGSTAWKALTKEEADDIRAAGLALMLCWELSADRAKGGTAAGGADGAKAAELAREMGVPPESVIYFAVDFDAQGPDIPAIEEYFRAARIACVGYSVGVYGGERVCKALSPSFQYVWQCVAWSGAFLQSATVHQYESQFGSNAKAVKTQVKFDVDLDRASTLYGMWLPDAPAQEPDAEPVNDKEETPMFSNKAYDILSKIQRWRPSLGLFYLALTKIWNLPFGSQVNDTIVAVATLLAATLEVSSARYYKSEARLDD